MEPEKSESIVEKTSGKTMEEEMKAKRAMKKKLKTATNVSKDETQNENYFKIQNLKSGSGFQLFSDQE